MSKPDLHKSRRVVSLPDRFPSYLRHSDHDTPVPTWQQVTRSVGSANEVMRAHISRIIAGVEDEKAAFDVWEGWSTSSRRSVAMLIDKIFHEGWLESVGQIVGWPWDGGFFFLPRTTRLGTLEDVLTAKTKADGVYTRCTIANGFAPWLSRWSHRAWKRGWIENDSPFASLHAGVFGNGTAEVHLDVFNPVFTNGAPRSDVFAIPGIGSYNRKLLGLHRKWERGRHAAITRTSANFYHFMQGRVPLSF
jgi:hypothetical protein